MIELLFDFEMFLSIMVSTLGFGGFFFTLKDRQF